jgi:hypothetical protein
MDRLQNRKRPLSGCPFSTRWKMPAKRAARNHDQWRRHNAETRQRQGPRDHARWLQPHNVPIAPLQCPAHQGTFAGFVPDDALAQALRPPQQPDHAKSAAMQRKRRTAAMASTSGSKGNGQHLRGSYCRWRRRYGNRCVINQGMISRMETVDRADQRPRQKLNRFTSLPSGARRG